jgi:hypothetical protein
VLFTIARILGGRPAGRLSKRQTHRALARSADDLRRIEGHPADEASGRRPDEELEIEEVSA